MFGRIAEDFGVVATQMMRLGKRLDNAGGDPNKVGGMLQETGATLTSPATMETDRHLAVDRVLGRRLLAGQRCLDGRHGMDPGCREVGNTHGIGRNQQFDLGAAGNDALRPGNNEPVDDLQVTVS